MQCIYSFVDLGVWWRPWGRMEELVRKEDDGTVMSRCAYVTIDLGENEMDTWGPFYMLLPCLWAGTALRLCVLHCCVLKLSEAFTHDRGIGDEIRMSDR